MAGVASDRLSVLSHGDVSEEYSVQHLLSCVNSQRQNCTSEHVDSAWNILGRYG